MSYSFKNSFSNQILNQNISISNSVILNNYSIQNVILPPSYIDINEKMPINENNYYVKENSNQNFFSPVARSSVLINIMPISLEQSSIYKNSTPLVDNKKRSRINFFNIKSIPTTKINKEIMPKTIHTSQNSKNSKKLVNHPRDSKKKVIKKKIKLLKKNIGIKIIKISGSTKRILQKIKNPSPEITRPTFPNNVESQKRKTKIIFLEPKEKLNLNEFQFGEQIGKGTFGQIFSVNWIINNKNYAMKKEFLTDIEEIAKRRENCKIIQNFMKNTGNKGVIRLYGNLCFKKKNNNNKENINEFIYYELMEKAERDWDKEINLRAKHKFYYTENELFNIMTQLITTLSLLEKHHITHRDIKPQNILVINGQYKLGDFGEIRVLKRDGLIVQRFRGSELYMSPILFSGLHVNSFQVRHNTYKSDVFSLGMCLFYAASLTYIGVDSIRELTNMMTIKNIIFQLLSRRYSEKLINFILSMLEVKESKRCNFIQLEEKLKNI